MIGRSEKSWEKYHCLTSTVYPKKYAHGFCFAVLCCGYTLTDFPISIRLISLALWLSNDCPSASKATLMNMDKYLMWIHYERLHNHNKAKHNKTVCIFLGIYCTIKWYHVNTFSTYFEKHQLNATGRSFWHPRCLNFVQKCLCYFKICASNCVKSVYLTLVFKCIGINIHPIIPVTHGMYNKRSKKPQWSYELYIYVAIWVVNHQFR